jgi:hypothetical protein
MIKNIFTIIRAIISHYVCLLLSFPFLILTIIDTITCSIKILFSGTKKEYSGYGFFGLAIYFYKNENYLLQKHGRNAEVNYFGDGNFNTSQLFFLPVQCLNLFCKAPTVFVFLTVFIGLFSCLIWTHPETIVISFLAMFVGLFSINTASQFKYQHYNMLGWMFVPLLFYFLMNHLWVPASITMLLISYGCPTGVFVFDFVLLILSVVSFSYMPLLIAVPANIKSLSHLNFHNWHKTKIFIKEVLKVMGAQKKEVKYKRKDNKIRLRLGLVLDLFLFLQFGFLLYLLSSPFFIIWLVLIFTYGVNTYIFRFADIETPWILFLFTGVCAVINLNNYWLLLSLFFMLNPFLDHYQVYYKIKKRFFYVLQKIKPLHTKPFDDAVEEFFRKIGENKRILTAFNDPHDSYEALFEDNFYRAMLEMFININLPKHNLVIPGYAAIARNNYPGAKEFWGREVSDVIKNAKIWNLDYIIVYQEKEENYMLDEKWGKNGFKMISYLNWFQFKDRLIGLDNFTINHMAHWWLLELPEN